MENTTPQPNQTNNRETPHPVPPNLEELFNTYYQKNGTGKYTRKQYNFYLKMFKDRYLCGQSTITEKQIELFLINGRKKGRMNPLGKAFIRHFIKFCGFEMELGKTKRNQNENRKIKYYTDEEFKRLIEYIEIKEGKDKMSLFLRTSRQAGLRKSEALNLISKDVNWENKTALITGKGNKPRPVFFEDPEFTELKNIFDSLSDNFTYFKSIYIYPEKVNHILTRYIKACGGLDQLGHHGICRHSYATNLRKAGMPLDTLSRLLGHASINTTMIYTHFYTDDLRNEVNKYREKK